MDVGQSGSHRACPWRLGIAATAIVLSANVAVAGEATVVRAEIEALASESFRVSVTVAHGDEGWDHYANRWAVFDADGNEVAERVLAHPHIDEQPFTRSATVRIPADVGRVRVRARDSVHGEGPLSAWIVVPH